MPFGMTIHETVQDLNVRSGQPVIVAAESHGQGFKPARRLADLVGQIVRGGPDPGRSRQASNQPRRTSALTPSSPRGFAPSPPVTGAAPFLRSKAKPPPATVPFRGADGRAITAPTHFTIGGERFEALTRSTPAHLIRAGDPPVQFSRSFFGAKQPGFASSGAFGQHRVHLNGFQLLKPALQSAGRRLDRAVQPLTQGLRLDAILNINVLGQIKIDRLEEQALAAWARALANLSVESQIQTVGPAPIGFPPHAHAGPKGGLRDVQFALTRGPQGQTTAIVGPVAKHSSGSVEIEGLGRFLNQGIPVARFMEQGGTRFHSFPLDNPKTWKGPIIYINGRPHAVATVRYGKRPFMRPALLATSN